MGIIMFYNNSLDLFIDGLVPTFTMPQLMNADIKTLLKPVFVLLCCVVLLVFQNSLRKKKKFDAIKKVELNYWLLLFGFLGIFFVENLETAHLLVISVPISILGGLILEDKKNVVVKEFVFILIIVFYFSLILEIF
jgi:hypothetical protein